MSTHNISRCTATQLCLITGARVLSWTECLERERATQVLPLSGQDRGSVSLNQLRRGRCDHIFWVFMNADIAQFATDGK